MWKHFAKKTNEGNWIKFTNQFRINYQSIRLVNKLSLGITAIHLKIKTKIGWFFITKRKWNLINSNWKGKFDKG